MTIKAVFFDIDGTLLNDMKSIPKATQKAIKQLKQQGIIVGVATGRGPSFVTPLMENLTLDVAITYNGQYIFTRDRVLYQNQLPKSVIYRVIRFASHRRRDISLGTAYGLVGSHLIHMGTSRLGQLISNIIPKRLAKAISQGLKQIIRRIKPQNSASLLTLMREPIYQIVLVANPSETQQLLDAFPTLTITRSSPYSVDLISPGQSKYQGISRVAEYFGFTVEEVMAFGDSDNDLDMVSQVGVGVAMANGTEHVKQAAHFTTLSNNHNGIPYALTHFGLLPARAEDSFVSKDDNFNKVKAFYQLTNHKTQECPTAHRFETAQPHANLTVEKLVAFLYASSQNGSVEFESALRDLHTTIDTTAKNLSQTSPNDPLLEQVYTSADLLDITYGSFVLMGVDPEPIFDSIYRAKMEAHAPKNTPPLSKTTAAVHQNIPDTSKIAIRRELTRQLQKAKQKQSLKKNI